MAFRVVSKKVFALLLAAITATAALSGCSNQSNISRSSETNSDSQNAKKEDYVIQYLMPGAQDSESLDNDVGKEIYKKFGIQIDIVGYAGDWEEKCATMLAGDSYSDMVDLQGTGMVEKYIKAGALQEIGALAEKYAPNFLTFYKDSIPYWKLDTNDGKFYRWCANSPDMEALTTPRFDMLVRSDILEQQGWPQVLDEDSYVNLLKQGLKDNPETDSKQTIGLSLGAADSWVSGAMCQLFAKGKYPENSGLLAWDKDQEKFVDQVLDVSSFKSGIKFWNRLYREGILDPECFTDTDAVAKQKLSTGEALSTFYTTWEINDVNTNLKKLDKSNMEYVTMPIMLKEQIDAKQKRIFPITDSYNYQSICITKNAKYPDRLMELVNWVCTDEGQTLLGWGIEGKHYTIDSNGIKTPTQEYIDCNNGTSSDDSYNDGVGTYYFLGLSSGLDKNGQDYNIMHDASVQNLQMDKRLKEIYSHYGWETVTDPWEKNTNFGYDTVHTGLYSAVTLETGSIAQTTETKLQEFKQKSLVGLFMASTDTEFESLWNEFTTQYEALNSDLVKTTYNDEYAKIKSEYDSWAS